MILQKQYEYFPKVPKLRSRQNSLERFLNGEKVESESEQPSKQVEFYQKDFFNQLNTQPKYPKLRSLSLSSQAETMSQKANSYLPPIDQLSATYHPIQENLVHLTQNPIGKTYARSGRIDSTLPSTQRYPREFIASIPTPHGDSKVVQLEVSPVYRKNLSSYKAGILSELSKLNEKKEVKVNFKYDTCPSYQIKMASSGVANRRDSFMPKLLLRENEPNKHMSPQPFKTVLVPEENVEEKSISKIFDMPKEDLEEQIFLKGELQKHIKDEQASKQNRDRWNFSSQFLSKEQKIRNGHIIHRSMAYPEKGILEDVNRIYRNEVSFEKDFDRYSRYQKPSLLNQSIQSSPKHVRGSISRKLEYSKGVFEVSRKL